MTQITQVVDALREAGASITFRLPGAYGSGAVISILPDDAVGLLADPRKFVTEKLGVTEEDLCEWENYENIPRCAERTKAGALCKNSVSPNTAIDPPEFAARHRQAYCHAHS